MRPRNHKVTWSSSFLNDVSPSPRGLGFILAAVLIALAGALPLPGQVENAEIIGTVRDSSDAVIPGAFVTLKSVATNLERPSVTDDRGNYTFTGVRIGTYLLTVTSDGFRTAKANAFDVRVGDRLRVDLKLQVGAVTEEMSVSAENIPLLETDTSSKGQIISAAQIRELPLNKRDYTQLALLTPGAFREPNHRLGGAMNINGNRALQNNFLLDGADNNSNATSFRGERVDVIRPSVDAVAEFKVQTNSYTAEFGRSAGAVINATLKSGSNQFHGTGWEFFRNDELDAHGWTPTNPPDLKRKLRFNLFGANVGGPIIPDKSFFFVNYEGERERNGQTYIATVPTAAYQNGDLSAFAGPVLDPQTGQPFPGNIIPRNRFDPVAAKILADPDFPKPNVGSLGTASNNYNRTPTDQIRSDKFDVRIDHHFSAQWRLFGRYSFSDLNRFRPTIYQGLPEASTNDAFGTTATRGQNLVVGVSSNLTPSAIGEFRIGYTRLGANVYPANFGTPSVGKLLGIPNLPDSPQINGGWPLFTMDSTPGVGGFRFGRTTSTPQFQIPNVFFLNSTMTLLRGAHSLKFGFDGQRVDTAVLDVSAQIGAYRFRNGAFTGNSWANFLLGYPSDFRLTTPAVVYNQKRIYALFIQDDFRVRHDLTLNLGLRYDYGTPLREKFNHLANFDRVSGQQVFAKDGSAYDRALIHPDRNDWGPRVGFAWTAAQKLVVRGAYGIFYNHTNRQGREGLLGMNNPFVIDLTRQNQTLTTPNLITLAGGPPANYLQTAAATDWVLRGNDPNLKNGQVQQWNLTLQYQFLKDWLFDAGYVGNRGKSLTLFFNGNQRPNIGQPRPFPTYGDVQFMSSDGLSNYHALQTKVERRWGAGLSFLQAFTYGRGLDNVAAWGDEFSGASLAVQNANNLASEYGLAGNSIKFNAVTNFVYELPFGKGKRHMAAAHPATEAFFGGWMASGIWTLRSGAPVTILSNERLGGERHQRANAVAGASPNVDNPTAERWFNTGAFTSSDVFGTAGRNTVYGPGFNGWDLSFAKNFPWKESRSFQFRTELFNAFNQVNYDRPGNNVSAGGFGRITTAQSGRSIQLGLKLYW